MMRVILDTSFILPTLGIDTGNETLEALSNLDKLKAQIYYSNLSMLECLWIIAKISKKYTVMQDIFNDGFRSITKSGKYESLMEPPQVYCEAFRLYREGHIDMIDNLLYVDSIYYDLKIITLDKGFNTFINDKKMKNTLIFPASL